MQDWAEEEAELRCSLTRSWSRWWGALSKHSCTPVALVKWHWPSLVPHPAQSLEVGTGGWPSVKSFSVAKAGLDGADSWKLSADRTPTAGQQALPKRGIWAAHLLLVHNGKCLHWRVCPSHLPATLLPPIPGPLHISHSSPNLLLSQLPRKKGEKVTRKAKPS